MVQKHWRRIASLLTASAFLAGSPGIALADHNDRNHVQTKTPIKHVVVIFQENVSFDHYFGTYPFAANPKGEPKFKASDDTPTVNGLLGAGLLDQNPNSAQPFRLDRTQAVTCDQDYDYADEQKAFNHGLMDRFPEEVGAGNGKDASGNPLQPGQSGFCPDFGHGTGLVMGYYDGNTVTALWNALRPVNVS